MTDKEFISGIIDDTYSKNDIIKYCSSLYSVKAFWGVLMSEYSKFNDNCPIVSFENNATITRDDNLTIEQKRILGRLLVAIDIVEEMMQQQSNVETQLQITPKKKQQKTIDDYILGEKDKVKRALSEMLTGKGGKDAAIIIAVFINEGRITKPEFSVIFNEYQLKNTKQAFNNAFKRIYPDNRAKLNNSPEDYYRREMGEVKEALKRYFQ